MAIENVRISSWWRVHAGVCALVVLWGTYANHAEAAVPLRASVQVRAQSQLPGLYNGCEVTSLSMLLSAAGHPVSRWELAQQVPKDLTPERRDANGATVSWGDPNCGFVGDVTGAQRGYGVYHGPLTRLLSRYLPGRALDLSGASFDRMLQQVASGKPLVVWTTVSFQPPRDFVTWQGPNGRVRATFSEHAVLLVGYDAGAVSVIDPLDGRHKSVDRPTFQSSWEGMGRQAVSYQ